MAGHSHHLLVLTLFLLWPIWSAFTTRCTKLASPFSILVLHRETKSRILGLGLDTRSKIAMLTNSWPSWLDLACLLSVAFKCLIWEKKYTDLEICLKSSLPPLHPRGFKIILLNLVKIHWPHYNGKCVVLTRLAKLKRLIQIKQV